VGRKLKNVDTIIIDRSIIYLIIQSEKRDVDKVPYCNYTVIIDDDAVIFEFDRVSAARCRNSRDYC